MVSLDADLSWATGFRALGVGVVGEVVLELGVGEDRLGVAGKE